MDPAQAPASAGDRQDDLDDEQDDEFTTTRGKALRAGWRRQDWRRWRERGPDVCTRAESTNGSARLRDLSINGDGARTLPAPLERIQLYLPPSLHLSLLYHSQHDRHGGRSGERQRGDHDPPPLSRQYLHATLSVRYERRAERRTNRTGFQEDRRWTGRCARPGQQ